MTRVSRRSWRLSPLTAAVRYGLGLTLIGAAGAALAQQDTSEVETDTVVVSATALKVATPTIETPRAVSEVGRDELDRRAVDKYDETFRYRSGVVSQPYGSDNNADWMFLRGFSAEGSTYQDGLRLFRTGGYFWWMTEPYGLERVELLKGPSSILYGEAPPGGLVNAVSKRPTAEPQGEIELQVGNKGHRQIGIDTSGPVSGRDDMRYRVVGMVREGDGELDGTDMDRYYFAPSLAVDVSEDTTVTFLASVQKDDGVPTTGFFPAYGTVEGTPFGKIDPETNLGQPDYDDLDQRQLSLGYELEHRINDTWEFQQNFRYSNLDLELRSVYPNSYVTPPRSISRGVVDRDGEYDAFTLDNRFIARTYTENTENTLLLGAGYQRLDLDYDNADSFRTLGDGSSYFVNIDTVDMFDPDRGAFNEPQTGDPTHHDVEKEQIGVYVQDQFRLNDKWIFLAGARYDSVDSRDVYRDETGRSREGYDDDQVSLTGGVMYLADNGLSPYVSYSESFTPLASTDARGESYEPLEGRQFEVGIKYAPPGFDGYVTVSAFDLEESNTLITSSAGAQRQIGERSSTGVEIEGVGYLTDNLKLTASYTYTDTRVDVSEEQQDEHAPLVPYNMASAWLDYDFAGALHGLSVGGGVRYVGSSANSPDAGETYQVPSHTLYDAVVRYDVNEHWGAQLNVNNLTDEEYISGCDFYCYYGESRSVIGSLSYRF
ncbi:Ferrichrome-iron receptor precursor [Halomonas sp. THAF12]|uniref:TonB-dependent siderophore receptor n=1 Tax=Halomonas sp. THAF12 TaxID=2587849 RepID=UPI001268858D|nr:TonB-dependent siderophore receptor [Halomonas sp. THAF12]QFT84275.1 Ferrichrome-iron receptor precursor [Halomonas sp. THAF12]